MLVELIKKSFLPQFQASDADLSCLDLLKTSDYRHAKEKNSIKHTFLLLRCTWYDQWSCFLFKSFFGSCFQDMTMTIMKHCRQNRPPWESVHNLEGPLRYGLFEDMLVFCHEIDAKSCKEYFRHSRELRREYWSICFRSTKAPYCSTLHFGQGIVGHLESHSTASLRLRELVPLPLPSYDNSK